MRCSWVNGRVSLACGCLDGELARKPGVGHDDLVAAVVSTFTYAPQKTASFMASESMVAAISWRPVVAITWAVVIRSITRHGG